MNKLVPRARYGAVACYSSTYELLIKYLKKEVHLAYRRTCASVDLWPGSLSISTELVDRNLNPFSIHKAGRHCVPTIKNSRAKTLQKTFKHSRQGNLILVFLVRRAEVQELWVCPVYYKKEKKNLAGVSEVAEFEVLTNLVFFVDGHLQHADAGWEVGHPLPNQTFDILEEAYLKHIVSFGNGATLDCSSLILGMDEGGPPGEVRDETEQDGTTRSGEGDPGYISLSSSDVLFRMTRLADRCSDAFVLRVSFTCSSASHNSTVISSTSRETALECKCEV